MSRLREQHLPVLLIGSFRPGDLEPAHAGDRHPFPPVLRETPRLFDDPVLDLSTAVGGASGRAFVNAVVAESIDHAPDTLIDSLFEQTAGLPLFVLGMLRWYQAAGILREDGEGRSSYRWSPELGNLPTEIGALFADLIDRLPHDLQALLNAASVQGATFSADIVMQTLGLSRATLIEMLDNQLERRFKVLGHGGVATIAGQPSHEYAFGHALLRDYVYHRMTDLERAHYHASTAEAMIALYGSGQHDGSGKIAFHFDRAGDRIQAARAYLRAGDHEVDHQEYGQAMLFFGRIGELDLRERDPFSVAQSLIGLGNCARAEGNNELAARQFTRADEIAQAERLRLVHANSLTSMGMLDFDAGRMRQGADRLSEAIEVLVDLGEMDEACRSLAMLSYSLHGMGNYDEAASAARRAMALAHDLGNDMFLVGGMIALANCWIDIGLFAEAIAIYEKGIDLSEEHGNLHRAAICRLNISLCEFEQGNWERASVVLTPIFDARNKLNDRLVGAAEFNAGVIAGVQGNLAEANHHYQASLDIRLENGQDALVIDSLAGLLRGAIATHDIARIRALLADIQARVKEQGFDGVEHSGRLFVTLVNAWRALGDTDCARFYLQRGVDFVSDRANRLADPAHRESYLANVPAHRQLMEMAMESG
jgi:tetratricopeptide (TPR) repeat protein